jgi:hypothetical protein
MPASVSGSSMDPGLYQASVFNQSYFDPSSVPAGGALAYTAKTTSGCAASLVS